MFVKFTFIMLYNSFSIEEWWFFRNIRNSRWDPKSRSLNVKYHLCTGNNISLTNGYSCETHYHDVIMGAIASQITSLTIVYSTVYSGADQRKHQSSASLAFVLGIHRWPVNSPHKWPVTRKMFPFDDVIMRFWNRKCPTSGVTRTYNIRIIKTGL